MNSVQIQKILQGCRVKKGKRGRPDKGDPSLLSVRRVTRPLQTAGPPGVECVGRGAALCSRGGRATSQGAAGRPCHHGASRSCPQTRKASRRQQLETEPGNWVTWGKVEGATWIDLEKIRWKPGRARKFPILEVRRSAGAIRTVLCAAPEGRAEPGGTDGRGRGSAGEEEAFYDERHSKRMQAPGDTGGVCAQAGGVSLKICDGISERWPLLSQPLEGVRTAAFQSRHPGCSGSNWYQSGPGSCLLNSAFFVSSTNLSGMLASDYIL